MTGSNVNILKKLHLILSEVGDIPKNGRNKHFNYDFVQYDDIVEKVRDLMVKHGVISYLKDTFIDVDTVTTGVDSSTGHPNRVKSFRTLTGHVVYVDVESGEELVVGPISGEAELTDDKSIRKAERQLSKIADMTTFKIVTGEPDLGEINEPPASSAVPAPPKAVATASKSRVAKAVDKKPAVKPATDLNELRADLVKAYGSQEAAVAAGNKKFKDKDWSGDAESLKALLADKVTDASAEA